MFAGAHPATEYYKSIVMPREVRRRSNTTARNWSALSQKDDLMLSTEKEPGTSVAIAIPVTGGRLCTHFGHCERFAIFEADTANRQILGSRLVDPPPHQPGLLPRWLHDEGANVVIAGGLGRRAQDIFNEQGIRVVVGASDDDPESIVQAYLDGNLNLAENPCDH